MATIPDKRYFTIGEVSALCELKPHVLRYWEQEFDALRPNKRRGNRRYYCREDVLMIQQIKYLLYEKGFTISGARAQLLAPTVVSAPVKSTSASSIKPALMRALLEEAVEILS